jgi:hypothetical protein
MLRMTPQNMTMSAQSGGAAATVSRVIQMRPELAAWVRTNPRRGPWETPEVAPCLEKGMTVVSQSLRVEGSVTSLSWIPREAIEGMTKIPFEVSVTRYDQPPPDRLTEGSLETWQDAGRFRFLNRLWAWAEIEDGNIVIVPVGSSPIPRLSGSPGVPATTGIGGNGHGSVQSPVTTTSNRALDV